MRYRLLVFDFDGTLADSFPFFLDAIDTLADKHGFRRIDRSRLATLRELDARQMLKHVGLPLWKAPRVGADFRAMMADAAPTIPLFDGVPAALERLHAGGVTLAILTSNSEHNVRVVLGERNAALFHHFSCGSALFGKHDKLRRLLKQAGVPAQDALCIGDEARDAEAARRAGVDFAAVSWGYTKVDALRAQEPVFLFEYPGQIPAAVLQAPA